jgi:hypothetical protein
VHSDERSEQVEFLIYDIGVLFVNLFHDSVLKVNFELGLIFNRNHSVLEHSSAFGDPKGNEILWLAFVGSWLGKHNSFDNFGEIS